MENVKQILAKLGIELDEEKQSQLEKEVLANYRTLSEVESKNSRITELEGQLAQANETIEAAKNLEGGNAQQVQALQEQVAAYQKADEERKAQAEEENSRKAFEEKFDKAVGEKKFVNDIVRSAVFDKAYALGKANPDMDVKAIVGGIVGDSDGVWENPQQSVKKMPGASDQNSGNGSVMTIQSLDDVKNMTVEEVRAHRDEIDKLLAQQK